MTNQDMTLLYGTLGEAQDNCDGLEVLLVDKISPVGVLTQGWVESMRRYGVKGVDFSDQSLGEGGGRGYCLWLIVWKMTYNCHLFWTILSVKTNVNFLLLCMGHLYGRNFEQLYIFNDLQNKDTTKCRRMWT